LEIELDRANKANAETAKAIKRAAANLLEVDTAVCEEAKARADIQDQAGIAERKGNVLASEVEEARMLVDTAERAKKNADGELAEAREHITDLTNANNLLGIDKRRLEGDLRGAQQELDNLVNAVKHAEEKARKAISDAGRLADELRTEQEHGLAADKANKMMASQCTEMMSRLADVEAMALRHGKKIIAKLEERCRALEDELGVTQMRSGDVHKGALKADRHIKELQFTTDENRKNIDRMNELVDKLQGKIRTYKKQIEDAEEIAALNLAKYRKAQQQLEEAEERSQAAESNMVRMRAGTPGADRIAEIRDAHGRFMSPFFQNHF